MTPKKPKAKSYQELKEVWYKKLAKSGFVDVESNEFIIKQPASSAFNRTSAISRDWQDRIEYSSMAGQFLHSHSFKNELEKVLWEYHANGLSIREIATVFKKAKLHYSTRDKVFRALKPLIAKMLQKYVIGYKPE